MKLNSLFADNAVLQRDCEIPVFGTAADGESVTVDFAGQKVSTVAQNGKWIVRLKPIPATSTPQSMTITGNDTITLTNLVVGDVWVASGQSNMERQLGPRPGQQELVNWREDAATADYPLIREYYVPLRTASTPQDDANGTWAICSPEAVQEFSAVGFYFARDIHRAQQIPIGILFSAWGGTPAESWTSAGALSTMPDFKSDVDDMLNNGYDPAVAQEKYEVNLARWYQDNDPGANGNWQDPSFSPTNWKSVSVPYLFDDDYDGIVWFRTAFELPNLVEGRSATINLGAIDDADTTWINGVKIGARTVWNENRRYDIPAGVLKPGKNVIAVRILDTGAAGGFTSPADRLWIDVDGDDTPRISLAREWLSRQGKPLGELQPPPQAPFGVPTAVTVLYNSMIAPLMQYPVKGVIWYQGESNNDRATQYRTLFPLMIADWRKGWDQGELPFLFVQIAPHEHMTPELREAQLLTLVKASNTAMAVTVDVGDAKDIHPANKGPVGARLALAARALAYGEKIEYSGPALKSMSFESGKAVLTFTHIGGGLVAKDNDLTGFTIAGSDKSFVPAMATIEGDKIVVWSDDVPNPAAVRYGWSSVPEVNLYNRAGLPASPFRTDVD